MKKSGKKWRGKDQSSLRLETSHTGYKNFGSNWESACRFMRAETQKQTYHGPSQKDIWIPLLQLKMGNRKKLLNVYLYTVVERNKESSRNTENGCDQKKGKLPKWQNSVKGHLGNSAWGPCSALPPYPPKPSPPPHLFTSEENLKSPSLQWIQCCTGSLL